MGGGYEYKKAGLTPVSELSDIGAWLITGWFSCTLSFS